VVPLHRAAAGFELPEDELEPIVEILASRGENGSASAARRARDFLISVADGTSGLDLKRLRTVQQKLGKRYA
jgi:hypothetical protein